MTPEKFKSHQLFEKIEQLSQRLGEDEIKETIELEKLAFFDSVHQYITDRIKLTIPILVQEAEMTALSSEIDKYSKRVSLQEIKENDHNLNIPRYVDSFEAEEEIDINAVAKQLQSLEKEMKDTDVELADYCKELNIETPF